MVANIHGRFKLARKAQTERLLKAASNLHTTILGHMTGRQLQPRPGYDIDVEKVLRACARHGVAVEINAHPSRLDLDWRWHKAALDFGCMMSINPDAHSIGKLDHMHCGVEMAREGGVPAERVLNAMSPAANPAAPVASPAGADAGRLTCLSRRKAPWWRSRQRSTDLARRAMRTPGRSPDIVTSPSDGPAFPTCAKST